MVEKRRMSPLTALFIGFFGLAGVGAMSLTTVVVYGMSVVEGKIDRVLGVAEGAITNLPEIVESLPPAVGELLNDRRAPSYAGEIDVDVKFVVDENRGRLRPAIAITNKGDEVVTMLALRVAALNEASAPIGEWTEVVATPIAIDDEWRGPLYPGNTRHVVLGSSYRGVSGEQVKAITAAVEVADVRVWRGDAVTTADRIVKAD